MTATLFDRQDGSYVSKGATISPDGKYRYLLWREWRGTHDPDNWRWLSSGRTLLTDGDGAPMGDPKACVFVMLNPSTADGEEDDPTIRRCVAFAKAWKFERLEVVNLFAYRATSPRDLLKLNHDDDPVGLKNSEYVKDATRRAGKIICAWGAHGSHMGQDETVLGWMPDEARTFVLDLTKDGHPKHPLYIRANAEPLAYV